VLNEITIFEACNIHTKSLVFIALNANKMGLKPVENRCSSNSRNKATKQNQNTLGRLWGGCRLTEIAQ
jgi:hypothetical protein